MKTEELTAIGLTEEQATQVLAINGKDIEKHKTRITTLEGERDNYKAQLDTANATLKKFEGIDPQQIQTELQTYKTQAEEAENDISSDDRDRNADEYGIAVVNKGESFIYDNGEWTDWTEYELRTRLLDDYAIDNFSIKAYMIVKPDKA